MRGEDFPREAGGTPQVGSTTLGPGGGGSESRFVFPSRFEENPGQMAHAGSGLWRWGGEVVRNASGRELILDFEL